MDFPIQSPQHGVRHYVIIQLNPFTVFIHVHFQALFQTARSALVSVSLVDRTTTLDRHREGERGCKSFWLHSSQLERQGFPVIIFVGGRSR